jgi:hypothetical protein
VRNAAFAVLAITALWGCLVLGWLPPAQLRRAGVVRLGSALAALLVVASGALVVARGWHPAGAASAPGAAAFDCRRATHRRAGSARGAIDSVASDGAAPLGNRIEHGTAIVDVGGWAYAEDAAHSAGACVVVDGNLVSAAAATYGIARGDVASAFGDAQMSASGFDVRLPAAALAPGTHRLEIAVVAPDGTYELVPVTRSVTVAR